MTKLRLMAAAVLLTVSVILLAWSLWPVERETKILNLQPAELSLPSTVP